MGMQAVVRFRPEGLGWAETGKLRMKQRRCLGFGLDAGWKIRSCGSRPPVLGEAKARRSEEGAAGGGEKSWGLEEDGSALEGGNRGTD